MPRELSQSQENRYRMNLLTRGTQSSQNHRKKVEKWLPDTEGIEELEAIVEREQSFHFAR